MDRNEKGYILKLVNGSDDGGVFTSESNYIRSLKKHGYKVNLIIIGEGDSVSKYQQIADGHSLLPALHANLGGSFISKLREIINIFIFGLQHRKTVGLDGTNYNAIIYRRPIFIFLAGMIGNRFNTKVFWHMPNIVSNRFSKAFYTYFLQHYKITPIANSEYTRQTLQNICKDVVYPGYSADRVRIISENYREELNIAPEAPVFGMAGRVCADKAQDILIKAFLSSEAIKRGAHLVIAGGVSDTSFNEKIRSLSGEYLGSRIHLLGRIDNLPKFYSTIDVALNGRRNAEPFGISIAEAQAAGKPVIAYYLGGPSEMIQHGATGWLVKISDCDSWKQAFNVAMSEMDRWPAMGLVALEGVGKFSVEQNVRKLLALIKS